MDEARLQRTRRAVFANYAHTRNEDERRERCGCGNWLCPVKGLIRLCLDAYCHEQTGRLLEMNARNTIDNRTPNSDERLTCFEYPRPAYDTHFRVVRIFCMNNHWS